MAVIDPEFHAALRALRLFLQQQEDAARRAAAPTSLSYGDWQAIAYVGASPGRRQSDLATALGVVPTTASSLVARLIKRGLIRSQPMSGDGRSVALSLTPEGDVIYGALTAALEDATARVYAAVPVSERAHFVATLIGTMEDLKVS